MSLGHASAASDVDLLGYLRELGLGHRLQSSPLDQLFRGDDTIGCFLDQG